MYSSLNHCNKLTPVPAAHAFFPGGGARDARRRIVAEPGTTGPRLGQTRRRVQLGVPGAGLLDAALEEHGVPHDGASDGAGLGVAFMGAARARKPKDPTGKDDRGED